MRTQRMDEKGCKLQDQKQAKQVESICERHMVTHRYSEVMQGAKRSGAIKEGTESVRRNAESEKGKTAKSILTRRYNRGCCAGRDRLPRF